MAKLLVIVPGRNDGHRDCVFALADPETGEGLASHLCSHSGYAYDDLYGQRPERIELFKERFGDVEVKFIDETDVDEDELREKNKAFHKKKSADNKG